MNRKELQNIVQQVVKVLNNLTDTTKPGRHDPTDAERTLIVVDGHDQRNFFYITDDHLKKFREIWNILAKDDNAPDDKVSTLIESILDEANTRAQLPSLVQRFVHDFFSDDKEHEIREEAYPVINDVLKLSGNRAIQPEDPKNVWATKIVAGINNARQYKGCHSGYDKMLQFTQDVKAAAEAGTVDWDNPLHRHMLKIEVTDLLEEETRWKQINEVAATTLIQETIGLLAMRRNNSNDWKR